MKEELPYGTCPKCGAKGNACERRPDGYTFCEKGHKYLHTERVYSEKKEQE